MNKSWWILNYARPCGPKPVVYEDSPPDQTIQLTWFDEQESYAQGPWEEGSPVKFNSEEAAIKYLIECGYKDSEIFVKRTTPKTWFY